MAKLSPEEQLERQHSKIIKLVFSSLSKRIADRAFISNSSDTILMCNPIGDRENRLITFLDPDLCVHLVKIKQPENVTFIKDWILGDLKYNLASVDCKLLCTGLNKLKTLNACKFITGDGLYRYFTNAPIKTTDTQDKSESNDEEIDQEDEIENTDNNKKSNLLAEVVGDTRTLMTISKLWRQLNHIGSDKHQSEHEHKFYNLKDISDVLKLSTGIGYLPIAHTDFGGRGKSEFLLTDGRSTPAYKEFILKSSNMTKWSWYVWKEDAKRLGYCTMFEDDIVRVKSWQPNNFIYLFDNADSKWEKIWH